MKGGFAMKYYFNGKTKTLHKIGACHFTKHLPEDAKRFKTEDEVIKAETKYFKHCKLCFKEEKKI